MKNKKTFKAKAVAISVSVCAAANPIITMAAESGLFEPESISEIEQDNTDQQKEETNMLIVSLKTEGGTVIINEGSEEEQTIRLESDATLSAYDKDGILISSENAEANNYVYIYECTTGEMLDVKAVSDDGFEVSKFDLSADTVNTFITPVKEFDDVIILDKDEKLEVEFRETSKDDDISLDDISFTEDSAPKEPEEDLILDTDNIPDSDFILEEDALDIDEEEKLNETEDSDELLLEEPNVEDSIQEPDVLVTEKEEYGFEAMKDKNTGEHFIKADESMLSAIAELNPEQFASKRLIVLLEHETDKIIDPEHILSNYENIYLMEYGSVEQTMNAFVYYNGKVLSVEPDIKVEAASEIDYDANIADYDVTENNNPIASLSKEDSSVTAQIHDGLIALIDTGANGTNVVENVSMIDDVLVGGTHGNEMVDFITSQNPNAKILSIRALDDNGFGSTASLVAAIRYAINSGAEIINLSLYQQAVFTSGVLFEEIQSAINKGIIVVGAAGNNNDDVMNYLPGRAGGVYTIGAANENGVKIDSSNYGAYVDYNVVAESTSEAAAKFTGYISLHGLDNVIPDNELIYETGYMPILETIPDLNVYYLCYDSEGTDLDTLKSDAMESILANGILKYKAEITPDGYLRSFINPWPKYVDYNENGVKLKVDIDRGGMGGIQQVITDECHYNAEEGYIDIPGKYAGLDITVTVWQSSDSLFYHNVVPDEVKPEHHRGLQIMPFQSWTDDWPGGIINNDFKAWGCNQRVKIKGNLNDIEVGKVYNFGSKSTTKYIGTKGCDWSALPGSVAYHNLGWAFGQVTTIRDCEEPMFNNIGTAGNGPLAGRNWIFAQCVAPNTNNTFAGDPLVSGGSYVQCISKESKTSATFYIRVKCHGPSGQNAQSMGCLFTADFESTGSVTISKKIGYEEFMTSSPSIKLDTEFTIYSDKECKKVVKKVPFSFGAGVPAEHVTVDGLKPGFYYIKETKTCPGCLPDKTVYKFSVTSGAITQTKDFIDVKTGKKIGERYWNNKAYKFKLLLVKNDSQGTKLPGAVFRVRYREKEGSKILYTWFFRTGDGTNGTKLGEVHYHKNYLMSTWVNPRTGKSYNSSPLITTNGSSYYLPEGYIDIQEVMAPNEDKKDDPTLPQYQRDSSTKGFVLKGTAENTDNYTNPIVNEPIKMTLENKTTGNKWKVRVQVKKVKETLEGLAGAKFGVFYDEECTESVEKDAYVAPNKDDRKYIITSGSDGMTEILTIANISEDQDSITLYCKELKAPNGYAATVKPYKLEFSREPFDEWITAGKNPDDYEGELKFFGEADGTWPNKEGWKVRVNAKKINEAKEPLEGAVFEVFIGEPSEGNKVSEELISGKDGMTNTISIGIPNDQENVTITCREKTPPKGYVASDRVYYLEFSKADFQTPDGELKTFGIDSKVFDDSDTREGIVNLKGWQVQVDAKKIDSDGKPLAGAVFGVFEDASCSGEPLATMTSNDEGIAGPCTIAVENAQDTIYLYCKEIEAPEGYAIVDTISEQLTFTQMTYNSLKKEFVDKGGKPEDFKGELKHFFPDGLKNSKGWEVQAQAKKVTADGAGLAGAEFGVYTDEGCQDLIGTLVSTADGTTNIMKPYSVPNDKESITLYCKETKAPNGYALSDEKMSLTATKQAYEAAKTESNGDPNFHGEILQFFPNGLVNKKVTPTPPGPQGGGSGAYVVKTSTAADDIMDLDSYELEGAEFSLTPDRADGTSGTFITNKDGISNSIALADNHKEKYHKPIYNEKGELIQAGWTEIIKVTTVYTVKETKAPKGHKMNYKPYTFSVTMPDDAGKTIKIPFEDEPYFCKNQLEIEKLGVKGNKLAGVVFKVEFFDSTGPDASKLKRTWYLESDENGMIYMDEAHISKRLGFKSEEFFKHDGKIVIPIDGYLQFTEVAAPAEYVVNDKPFGMATGENANLSKRVYNDMELCEVKLKKYEDDGVTPIAGVEFEIKFLEATIKPTADKNEHFGRLLEEGESYISSTDENGELVFKGLDHGKYQITEVRTHSGNTLLKEPIIFNLPMTMTEEEANEYGNVDFSTAEEDKSYTDKWFFYSCLFEITNHAKFIVPMTGGNGIWKIGFVGMGVLAMVGTGLIVSESSKKKRKRKKKK